MGEVDSDGIAIDSVLMLFFLRKLFLLGLRLGLRDVRGVLRCIRTIAIDRVALRCRHRLCPGSFWARDTLFGLELLHRSGQLLLMLALLRVPLCLHLLLRRKADYLLGIRRSGRMVIALAGAAFLLPLNRLETLAMPIRATMTTRTITRAYSS